MKRLKLGLILTCGLTAQLVGSAPQMEEVLSQWYIRFQGGVSFPNQSNICINFEPSVPVLNNSTSKSYLVGFGIGYNLYDWLSMGVAIDIKPLFEYFNYQPAGTKVFFADIANSSYMLDVFFNHINTKHNHLSWQLGPVTFSPYIGGSIGISQTTLAFFNRTAQVVENPINSFSFAWQAQVGGDIALCDYAFFSLAYRYFNGGRFRSNHWVSDNPGIANSTHLCLWNNKLKLQDVVAALTLEF